MPATPDPYDSHPHKSRLNELSFREMMEALPHLLWTCLPDGPCDYLSPQWVHYTGISEAEQLGYGWLQQLHPDDRSFVIEHWTLTAAEGIPFEVEFRIRRHDGIYRWFRTLALPVRNDAGTITHWFGTNIDIESQKRSEAALRSSEDRFHLAMLHSSIGKAIVAPDGRWLDVNPALCNIVGYTEDELLKIDFQFITHPDDIATDLENARLLQTGEIQSFTREKRYFHKNGNVIWIHLCVVAIRDAAGAHRYNLVEVQDITHRKELEIRQPNQHIQS